MRRLIATWTILAVLSPAIAGGDVSARLAAVCAVEDSMCLVTNVAYREKSDPTGSNPLAKWAATAREETRAVAGGFVRVDFVLKAEPGSDVRCRLELPMPDRWDGRLWGFGNSGHAGALPNLQNAVAEGGAAMTTELGTWSVTDCGKSNGKIWPEPVCRDFAWRATHLMTVYGKRMTAAFYGRKPAKCYFNGGSTGGRQAMSEAIRYPDDYDGIIAHLPANNSAVNELAIWHLWRQTHDADGRILFSAEEMQAVADAAVVFRAKTDPPPYAGSVLADARFDAEDVDGFLALAAERMPSLSEGDKLRRLRAIYLPLVIDGKCWFNGFAPGSYLGKNMTWMGIVNLRAFLRSKGFGYPRWKDVTTEEIKAFLASPGEDAFNACSPDLRAFARRGGKLIMTAGWEDQTISPLPIVDYYERVCERDGGIGKTKAYFRLFCVPGCAHGGGRGRAMTGAPGGAATRKRLVDWCECGRAPEAIEGRWVGKMQLPVAAYPGLFVKNAADKWERIETRRRVTRIDDLALVTDVNPEKKGNQQ